jgi:hypothetical protein
MTLAGFRGINMVFHNVTPPDMAGKRAGQLDKAQQLYGSEVKPLLENGATKAEVLAKVKEIAEREKWPIGDLSLD